MEWICNEKTVAYTNSRGNFWDGQEAVSDTRFARRATVHADMVLPTRRVSFHPTNVRRDSAPDTKAPRGRRASSFSSDVVTALLRRRRSSTRKSSIYGRRSLVPEFKEVDEDPKKATPSILPTPSQKKTWKSATKQVNIVLSWTRKHPDRLKRVFIRTARLIILVHRWHTPHMMASRPYLCQKFHRQLGAAAGGLVGAEDAAGILFDLQITPTGQHEALFNPSEYKANTMMRLSEKAKQILQKRPDLRTDDEVYYAMLALRQVPQIEDYPVRMQRELARHGVFQSFNTKRVIVQQRRPPNAFYFILYGKVLVAVEEYEGATPKTACYLKRGESFGELSIIENSHRQSSVLSVGYTELLAIHDETYRKVFMVGGVRNIHDPDHQNFIQNLQFLRGWPLSEIGEDPKLLVFNYFGRGSVICRNSEAFNWIVIVKSGSVSVLAKLGKRKPAVSSKTGRANRRSLATPLTDRGQVLQKFMLGPESRVRTASWTVESDGSSGDDDGEDEKQLVSDVHDEHFHDLYGGNEAEETSEPPLLERAYSSNLLALPPTSYPNGTTRQKKPSVSRSKALQHLSLRRNGTSPGFQVRHITREQNGHRNEMRSPEAELRERKMSPRLIRPHSATGERRKALTAGKKRRVKTTEKAHTEPNSGSGPVISDDDDEKDVPEEEEMLGKRTIIDDLEKDVIDNGKRLAVEETSEEPEFVRLQTLIKGDVFGLQPVVHDDQPGLIAVSNGAECILLNRKFFVDRCDVHHWRKLRHLVPPFPTREELQENLQSHVNWNAFRQATVSQAQRETRGELMRGQMGHLRWS